MLVPMFPQPPPSTVQPSQRWACSHMGYSQRSSEPYSAGMQMGACRSRMREICVPVARLLRSSLAPLNQTSRAKFSESDCSSPRKPTFQVASSKTVCAIAAIPGVCAYSSFNFKSLNRVPFGVAFQSKFELFGSRKSSDLDQLRIHVLSATILNHSTQCSFRSWNRRAPTGFPPAISRYIVLEYNKSAPFIITLRNIKSIIPEKISFSSLELCSSLLYNRIEEDARTICMNSTLNFELKGV